ncbi:hypothetical protein ACFWUW_18890 [Streptomyces sp. NPDC058655]|uniref:hypothetical protein n=1 Tax=Streptomyces sp. NPDC058655 TaxID=3346577 RepID=UPI0036579477
MRFAWFVWLARHFGEYGYGDGPLRGAIGTLAVLLTAALTFYTLRRHRAAAAAAAGVVCIAGLAWLAAH